MRVRGVNFLLVKPDNTVLVQLRDNRPDIESPGKWCFPGGALNAWELPKRAAVREVEEETGLKIREEDFFPFYELVYQMRGETYMNQLYFAFVLQETQVRVKEGADMQWLTWEEIEDLNRAGEFAQNNGLIVAQFRRTLRMFGRKVASL